MKKMFKKSIAMLIAVLMVISAMPITALASDNNLEIKTNVKIAGYENQYGLMYYNSGNKVDYIFSVIKEANSDGVITVKKGSNLTVTQSFGTWTNVDNSAPGDTNIAKNGLKWHYGNGTDYAIASVLNHDNKANNWNAYISGDTSKAIQSSVSGTMANKNVQNSLRSTASEGGTNEATGIYTMTPQTFPQLNTPGEYKIDLWSTVSFMNWKYNFPSVRWCSIYGTQNPVTITVRVVDDYTFEKANGNKTIISDISKENALKKAPALDSATKKLPNNDGTHSWTEYSWVETSESYFKETGAIRNGNCNYGAETSVVETPATCGTKGTMKYTKTCTDCGHESVRYEEIPATGEHDYVYTKKDSKVHTVTCKNCDYTTEEAHDIVDGKCTKCGYIAPDLSAYNAANQTALDVMSKDREKYTSESLEAYMKAIQPYLGKQDEFTTQEQVNDYTYKLVSAEVLLQKKNVTITFVVEKEDGSGTITTDPQTADWGQSVTLDTQSNYVSKWTITVNGVTSKIDSNAKAIDHIATEDATITAYVSNEQSDTKYSKVTFLGKNSAVVGIKYVAADTTVDTNTLLTVPAIPFYENGKWDKAEIKADGSNITVRATYVPQAVNENKCGIHFNGETKYYNYDSYVYLFNADKSKKYAMYADANETQLITYFDGVDFYAPRRDNLYIKEVTDTSAMTATIGFTGSYKQDTTSSFNVKFWLPDGATLVETGVDLVAKFPDGTVKSAHDRATKFSERNEYTYSAKFGDSKKTIEFKPYLTYKKGGTTTTVYGASQTVKY